MKALSVRLTNTEYTKETGVFVVPVSVFRVLIKNYYREVFIFTNRGVARKRLDAE